MFEQEPGTLALSPTSFPSATLSSRACCFHMPAQPGHFLPGSVFESSHEYITLSDVCRRGDSVGARAYRGDWQVNFFALEHPTIDSGGAPRATGRHAGQLPDMEASWK